MRVVLLQHGLNLSVHTALKVGGLSRFFRKNKQPLEVIVAATSSGAKQKRSNAYLNLQWVAVRQLILHNVQPKFAI